LDTENGGVEFGRGVLIREKKSSRIKLDGDCVLRTKLLAGSVQTQKSLIKTCKLTAHIAPVQTEEDYFVARALRLS
jgi:hypothetical protein